MPCAALLGSIIALAPGVSGRAEMPAIISPGGFALQGPERLVLGRDNSATIRYQAPKDARLRFYINTGRIDVHRFAGIATYTTPTWKYPQLAIMAVFDIDTGCHDWLSFPLLGCPTIQTKTEHGALVSVQVGQKRYGPVRADDQGNAPVEVDVPPGVVTVQTIVQDRMGNTSITDTDLRVPALNHLLAVCPPSGDRIVVFVADAFGQPLADLALELRAAQGVVGMPVMIAPGVYLATYKPPEDARIGDHVKLDAAITGEYASAGSCQVEIRASPLDRLAFSVTPDAITTGSPEPLDLTAGDREILAKGRGTTRGQGATIMAPVLKPFAVIIRAGYATNFGRISSPLVMAEAEMRLPVLDDRLLLGLAGGFLWRFLATSVSDADNDADNGADSGADNDVAFGEQVSITLWVVPLLLRAGFQIPVDIMALDLRLRAGLAGGALIIGHSIKAPSAGFKRQLGVALAGMAFLGADMALGPGRAVVEAAYLYAPDSDNALRGNFGGLHLLAGYSLEFSCH